MNTIVSLLTEELNQEIETTRKMLARIPDEQHQWQPHAKSMKMRQLATHIAEIPGWIALAITTNELDFAAGTYEPTPVNNTEELLSLLEKSYTDSRLQLEQTSDEYLLNNTWTMRAGEQIYLELSKYGVIRHAFAQLIHHRAQLGVYLRLLNIPIPGSYGPSADEMEMAF